MATEAVLKYLTDTNRPYSANDIVLNLHKEFSKGVVQKALDALALDSRILEKTYGKQKVYVVRQDDAVTPQSDSKEIDADTARLTKELKETEDALKSSEAELKGLQTTLTTEEALRQSAKLEKEVKKLTEKLDELSKNTAPVSPGKLAKVQKEFETSLKEYRSRKRLCMDMLDCILEGYPKPKKALMEDLGLETDEDVNFMIKT